MADLIQQFNTRVLPYVTPAILWPLLCLCGIVCFFVYYWRATAPRKGTLEWIHLASQPRPRLSFSLQRHPMTRTDALPLLLLCVCYAATAFFQLGSVTNPQSFASFAANETATIALAEETTLSRILYYPGLNTGSYTLEVSTDGVTWRTLLSHPENKEAQTDAYYDWTGTSGALSFSHKYSEMFKWLELQPQESIRAAYIRITGHPDGGKRWLELGELALYDADGILISGERIRQTDENSALLLDEPSVIPETPSWYNSSYFDEIYHPRTALEHIRGIYPYEITHPPLGKLIMSLGIRAFGMTPFGWRFMGTLFGVGMLPILYIFLKNLFGKTAIATCGTILFAVDFMHLTQTRIGTIDTYGVFFILCMYYFMYRYLTTSPWKNREKTEISLPGEPSPTSPPKRVKPSSQARVGYLNLFLSGLMWGIGAASKWTVIYGAAGLALLYFIGLYFKWRDWPRAEGAPRFGPWLAKTLLFSVLCFVLIPAVIYTLSYWPYAAAKGDATLQTVIKEMINNQKYMFSYHEGVTEPHGYSSRWYQWIVNGRPILYYLDNSRAAEGLKTAFGAFHNPLISWAGLAAIVTCGIQVVRRRCGVALFFVVGYLSQLVPWMFIFRTTFAYHYFPSVLFLVLALAYTMNDLWVRNAKGARVAVYGLTGASVALYAAFYPVLIGLTVASWYPANFLRWIPGSWPF